MLGFSGNKQEPTESSKDRLDSWKEIAGYLRRDVSTVQRWEREEDLPVRRHFHGQRPTVYAYSSDLDDWWNNRRSRFGEEPGVNPRTFVRLSRGGLLIASILAGVLLASWLWDRVSAPSSRTIGFGERDWVLITDFEDTTESVTLADCLKAALTRELGNSTYVNVVPRERVEDALRLMRKKLDTRLTARLGREVCLRDGGIRALLSGRVEKLGTGYLLGVRIIDPVTGTVLLARTEDAEDESELVRAVLRLSAWARGSLGEVLPQIPNESQKLAKVTTPSLNALRLFTQADTLLEDGDDTAAVEHLKLALLEDPDFAAAYVWMAIALKIQGNPPREYLSIARKGLALLDHVSERERYLLQAKYYRMIEETDQAIPVLEALLSRYPDDHWGNINLLAAYLKTGRVNDAAELWPRLVELRPNDFWIHAQAAQFLYESHKDIEAAENYLTRARALFPPDLHQANPGYAAWIEFFPIYAHWLRGNPDLALLELQRRAPIEQTPYGHQRDIVAWNTGCAYLTLGKLKSAEEAFYEMRGVWKEGEDPTVEQKTPFLAVTLFLGGKETQAQSLLNGCDFGSLTRNGTLAAIIMARLGLLSQAERLIERLEEDGGLQYPQEWHSIREGWLKAARGELALSRGHANLAVELLAEGVESLEPKALPEYFLAVDSLSRALVDLGNTEKSIALLEQASETRVRTGLAGAAFWLETRASLAKLLRATGKLEKAQQVESELRQLLTHADQDHPILVKIQ